LVGILAKASPAVPLTTLLQNVFGRDGMAIFAMNNPVNLKGSRTPLSAFPSQGEIFGDGGLFKMPRIDARSIGTGVIEWLATSFAVADFTGDFSPDEEVGDSVSELMLHIANPHGGPAVAMIVSSAEPDPAGVGFLDAGPELRLIHGLNGNTLRPLSGAL